MISTSTHRWSPGRATTCGAHSESGMDTEATIPTSALAVPAPKPASRHSVANQPKTT